MSKAGSKNTDIDSIRSVLSDKEELLNYIENFIDEHIIEKGDSQEVIEMKRALESTIHKDNIETIFHYAESPIERIFLSALAMDFLVADPLGLIVMPPRSNAPDYLRIGNKELRTANDLCTKYLESTGDYRFAGFDRFLDQYVATGEITADEKEYAVDQYVRFELPIGVIDAFHLMMQAGFPDLQIDGKSIRVDVLIWIPKTDEFKFVVECDGYEFHSSRGSFSADRRRDRALTSEGFRILRFSGSEIFNDPVAVSVELFKYLHRAYPRGKAVT